MKTLLILRHAKSGWDNPSLNDHDRTLTKRGLKTAPLMGQLIADQEIVPDRILSSTARRARETAFLVGEHCGYSRAVELNEDLYPTSVPRCIDALSDVSDDVVTLLLVAHNPGLEHLVELLTGSYEVLPTAALVQVTLEMASWSDMSSEVPATLVNFWRPRELF